MHNTIEIFVFVVMASYVVADLSYLASQYALVNTLLCAFWSLCSYFQPRGTIKREQRIRIIAMIIVVNSIFMFLLTQQPIFGVLSICAGLVLIFA